jgi:hypothetical protein
MRRTISASLIMMMTLAACGVRDQNPVEPESQSGTAASTPTPNSPPLAVPAQPQPSPIAAPQPDNSPPVVTVRFEGPSGCHPRRLADGVIPCSVDLRAEASDPDGDPLTFSWSGCAAGSAAASSCRIDSPGSFVATVLVRDRHGAKARASVTAQGVNGAPFARFLTPAPARVGQPVEIFGSVQDPDDGAVCGRQWCVRAEAGGACGPNAFLDCTCLGELYGEVRPHSPGTCTFEVTMRDDWGLEGKTVLRVEVSAP